MYSLLLVDDEISILNGLYQNVSWDELQITTVYKASFVKDAIEIIKQEHIDLVITDINMPEMNGMELAKMIHENWPYTKIIFLSGYQQFTYAVTAVELGVFRYLLKPVSYVELQQVASEAIAELASELAYKMRMHHLERLVDNQRPWVRERILSHWLSRGNTEYMQDEKQLAQYDIHIKPGDWGFMVAVRYIENDRQAEQPFLRHMALCQSATEILNTSARMLDYFNSDGITILVFLMEDELTLRREQGRIITSLESFQHAIQDALQTASTIFWTSATPVKMLPATYTALKQQIRHQLVLIPNVIIAPDFPTENKLPFLQSMIQRPYLNELIAGLQKEETLERLHVIFNELTHTPNINLYLLQVYHEITGALINDSLARGMSLMEWAKKQMAFLERFSPSITLEQFHQQASDAIIAYMDYVQSTHLTKAKQIVMQVKHLVHEHLSEPITVTFLALQLNYHPNYLSQIFKQETGLALQDYITHKRMMAAKALLVQGTSVGEVASQVGYANIAHFSRIFKRLVGMPPKQYQQSGESKNSTVE